VKQATEADMKAFVEALYALTRIDHSQTDIDGGLTFVVSCGKSNADDSKMEWSVNSVAFQADGWTMAEALRNHILRMKESK
jgi:hypothetical protein